MKYITRTIWILSLVSLFTDIASESLYPVMPIYLQSIGFSIILIGILEGVAEAIAGMSKGYFGNLSDNLGKRLPFVQLGYGLSAFAKPMIALFTSPLWVFFSRTLDRLGKGIRTGARDALLSDESTPETKGRVFGFHRSFDTLGAVIGPSLALAYLYYYPTGYKTLFLLAFVPGILAVFASFLIQEKKQKVQVKTRPGFFDFLKFWKQSRPLYKQLVGALLVFALFNSSDVFLLLKMKDAGIHDTTLIGVYIFYNLVYALFAYPLGILADKMGMKKVLFGGLILFAVVYIGMAYAVSVMMFFILFFFYGIYAGATEGVVKAWISNISDKNDTATAIGTYTGFQSIATLIASSGAGLIWYTFGASSLFLVSGIMAMGVALYIFMLQTHIDMPSNANQ